MKTVPPLPAWAIDQAHRWLNRVPNVGLSQVLGTVAALITITSFSIGLTLNRSWPTEWVLWGYASLLPLLASLTSPERIDETFLLSRRGRWLFLLNRLAGMYIAAIPLQAMLALLAAFGYSLLRLTHMTLPQIPTALHFVIWFVIGITVWMSGFLGGRSAMILSAADFNRTTLVTKKPRMAEWPRLVLQAFIVPLFAYPSLIIFWLILRQQYIDDTPILGVLITAAVLAGLAGSFAFDPHQHKTRQPYLNDSSENTITLTLREVSTSIQGAAGTVCIEVSCPKLGLRQSVETTADELYDWLGNWSNQNQSPATALEHGLFLGRLLFPDSLQQVIEAALSKAVSAKRTLTLCLHNDAFCARLPWECALLHTRSSPPAFAELLHQRDDLCLLRTDGSDPVIRTESPSSTMIFAASPQETLPEISTEIQLLKALSVESAPVPVIFIEKLTESTLKLLPPARWFHFAGHGFTEQDGVGHMHCYVQINDDLGKTRLLDAETLGLWLAQAGVTTAIISACDSAKPVNGPTPDSNGWNSLAHILLQHGLTRVIAMQYPISDASANQFAHHFYRAIFQGDSTEQALLRARRALAREYGDVVAAGAPVLCQRSINAKH